MAGHRRDAQWKVEVSLDANDLFSRLENGAALPLLRVPSNIDDPP